MNRILDIPGTTPAAEINTYWSGSRTYTLKSDTAIKRIRQLAKTLDHLGYEPHEIGLHSICTAAAMAIDEKTAVQDLPYEKIQKRLKTDGQVLVLEERLK